jgi:hypothetical protein
MIMIRIHLYCKFFFFFCLFMACTFKPCIEFLKEETITQELMPLKGITSPNQLEIKNPYLIVSNSNRKDSLFHI